MPDTVLGAGCVTGDANGASPWGAGTPEGCSFPYWLSQPLVCLQPPGTALQETGWGRARARVPPCSSSKNRALGKAEALNRREDRPVKLAEDRINDATATLHGGPRYSGKAASGQDGPLSWWARPALGSLGEETEQTPENRHRTRSARKRQKDQWQRWRSSLAGEELPRRLGPEAAPPASSLPWLCKCKKLPAWPGQIPREPAPRAGPP